MCSSLFPKILAKKTVVVGGRVEAGVTQAFPPILTWISGQKRSYWIELQVCVNVMRFSHSLFKEPVERLGNMGLPFPIANLRLEIIFRNCAPFHVFCSDPIRGRRGEIHKCEHSKKKYKLLWENRYPERKKEGKNAVTGISYLCTQAIYRNTRLKKEWIVISGGRQEMKGNIR